MRKRIDAMIGSSGGRSRVPVKGDKAMVPTWPATGSFATF